MGLLVCFRFVDTLILLAFMALQGMRMAIFCEILIRRCLYIP